MTVRNVSSISGSLRLLHAPICIVGAGIAGLLVARRLAAGGQRVIVVESGGDATGGDVNLLNEIDDPAAGYTRATTGRNRGFGGTSSHWGGRMIPISDHDTAARPHVALPAWPFPVGELDGYDVEIEALFRVAAGSHEEIPAERRTASRAFPAGEPSLTPRWAKCPSFRHCNLATLLGDELRRSEAIDIWLGATVCGFELDRDAGRLA